MTVKWPRTFAFELVNGAGEGLIRAIKVNVESCDCRTTYGFSCSQLASTMQPGRMIYLISFNVSEMTIEIADLRFGRHARTQRERQACSVEGPAVFSLSFKKRRMITLVLLYEEHVCYSSLSSSHVLKYVVPAAISDAPPPILMIRLSSVFAVIVSVCE